MNTILIILCSVASQVNLSRFKDLKHKAKTFIKNVILCMEEYDRKCTQLEQYS